MEVLNVRRRRAIHSRNEAVASPGDVRDIALAFPTVTEGTTKLRDVDSQVALLNRYVGPNSRHELALADNFARATDQDAEKIESTTADRCS
jgi:hypothetical protein